MEIEHIKFSGSMSFFKDRVIEKYGLKPVTSLTQPCVLWGAYTKADYDFIRLHKAPVILVFRGADATQIKKFNKNLLKIPVKVYAPGIFVSNTLTKYGVDHEILPLTGCPIDIDVEPRGDHIYHYGNIKGTSYYGNHLLEGIEKRTGLKVIKAHKNTYTREGLFDVYRQCFIGLRLTLHDGLPNTVLELGMMGRRSIYNGDIPHSISWQGINDICDSIMQEYKHGDKDNERISRDIKNHINIGKEWLKI